jgi:hypothetical protein
MFVIIGMLVVFGAVVAGYLMEHGNLKVLIQPAELVISGGAAVGTVLIANPLHIVKAIAGGIGGVFGGAKYGKASYLETLKMMYELFGRARKERIDCAGDRQRCAGQEPDILQISEISERSSRAGVCVRHDSNGGWRRSGTVRCGPDDGAGYGGAPP